MEKIDKLKSKLATVVSPFQKADLLNEIAWHLRYESTKESLEYARQARSLSEEEDYPRGVAYGKLYQAIAWFLLSMDEPILVNLLEARDYFEGVKEEEIGYPLCLNFLALLYESYGDYETGLSFAQKSLTVARKSVFREAEGDTLSTLGLIYSRLCDFSMAIESHQESLKIREELQNDKAVASSLNLIARIYALTGEYEKGMDYYLKSLALREKIDDLGGLPWTYLGIASLLEKKKDFEGALMMYTKSIEVNKGKVEKRCELQCILGLGRIHLQLRNREKALENLEKARNIAEEIKAKPLLYEVHLALGEYYEWTGDLGKALEHFKLYQQLEREVHNAESLNRLKNQQVAFATEQAKREAEIFRLRNVELKNAFDIIEQKNTEIIDSIRYAQRIQKALIIPDEQLEALLHEYFILHKPKDIVSGDFYWIRKLADRLFIVAADCTGHGVPGGFLSMLGMSFLDEVTDDSENLNAGQILDKLRSLFVGSLHQSAKEGGSKDGMDISLCIYEEKEKALQFAGAYNSLYHIRKKELTEYRADRMPIAFHWSMDQPFTNNIIPVKKGDIIYLFSDGYADQFGGPDSRKFMSRQMKEILLSVHDRSMADQKKTMDRKFEEWKGSNSQTDDVLLIGIRF